MYSHFSSILITLKFSSKTSHFGPFLPYYSLSNWLFLLVFKILSSLEYGFFSRRFWPFWLTRGYFCHFSKSCHFSNIKSFTSSFSHGTVLMLFYSHFSSILITLKLSPKTNHFWLFCLPIAFAKWLFLPLFKILSFLEY